MEWKHIDTQADLDALEDAVCWEDSQVIEYHAGNFPRPYFPADVSRTGHHHPDIHVLVEDCCRFMELVFIHCDHVGANVFQNFYVSGKVRSLKRVELTSRDGSVRLRCGRLIWRRADDVDVRRPRYLRTHLDV